MTEGEDERNARLDGVDPARSAFFPGESDHAAEDGDRRIDARRVAVKDSLPSHRVLTYVVRRSVETSDRTRDRHAERGRATETPTRGKVGRRLDVDGW